MLNDGNSSFLVASTSHCSVRVIPNCHILDTELVPTHHIVICATHGALWGRWFDHPTPVHRRQASSRNGADDASGN